MAGVTFSNVSKVFRDGTKGVDRLDLEVRAGELLVLVGPSGSGKTTTLRLLAGLEQPTSGTISLDGREVTQVAPRDRNVAMVFQGLGLLGHLSARKNMAFGLLLRQPGWAGLMNQWLGVGGSSAAIDEQVQEAARLLRIEQLLDKKPGELSGGEQQRVALGRAIVRRPAAFLLDEPLSSLDPQTRLELRRELKQLHHRLGVTTMYVTHDPVEAMALADRIAVIRCGRLEQVGTPQEVYGLPQNRFVAGFLGWQGMNFLAGAVAEKSGQLVFRAGDCQVELSGDIQAKLKKDQRLVLGIRPEHVTLEHGSGKPGTSLAAVVSETEWLGDQTWVQLELVGELDGTERARWLSRVSADRLPARGDRVRLGLASERIHWFDAETGDRIANEISPRQ